MANIAMMIGGAILNAAAFSGGNHLARYLSGDSEKAALAEKTRQDKALEAYQAAMAKYTRDHTMLLDWIEPTEKSKNRRSRTSRTPITRSNSITRPTQTSRSPRPKSLVSLTFISPVSSRNKASFFL